MIGVANDEIVYVPFSKAIKKDKPINRDLLDTLRRLSIWFALVTTSHTARRPTKWGVFLFAPNSQTDYFLTSTLKKRAFARFFLFLKNNNAEVNPTAQSQSAVLCILRPSTTLNWSGLSISKWLSLLQQVLVRQEIQESDSQHTEFVLLAVNIITNNDNLTKVVIDWQ